MLENRVGRKAVLPVWHIVSYFAYTSRQAGKMQRSSAYAYQEASLVIQVPDMSCLPSHCSILLRSSTQKPTGLALTTAYRAFG